MDVIDIVGSLLIHVIVEPILEEKVAMSPPRDQRWLGGVIVGVIVIGHMDGETLGQVTLILCVESER